MFFYLSWPKITNSIVRRLISRLSLLIKWFLPSDMSFHFILLCFFCVFFADLLGVWLYHHTIIDLFVGFCVGDSYGNAISI